MKFPYTLLLLLIPPALTAQDQSIPNEVIGDTGWISYGPADTLILVRAADGHVWLQQNLGSEMVAGASTGAAAYGGYFQWGRWDDGHAEPTSTAAQASTLSPNNPNGLGTGSPFFYMGPSPTDWWGAGSGSDTWSGPVASATNGIDPCTALGEGWQLPSKEDWSTVCAAENITGTPSALASNLHLPATGHRNGETGTFINAGLYGQYWSSTVNGSYAKDLTVGDTTINADDDGYRSHGMCVRCLNKELHVGLREEGRAAEARAHPNPSAGSFTVQGAVRMERIRVFAADMRLVGTWYPNSRTAFLSLDRVAPGSYRVCVSTGEGEEWLHVLVTD